MEARYNSQDVLEIYMNRSFISKLLPFFFQFLHKACYFLMLLFNKSFLLILENTIILSPKVFFSFLFSFSALVMEVQQNYNFKISVYKFM